MIASSIASAAPEFMFVCAVSQWIIARQLQLQLNHLEEHRLFEQEVACERCKQNESSEESCTPQRVIRRLGTVNEFENGYGHTRSDIPIQSDARSAQQTSKPLIGTSQKTSHYSISQALFIVSGGLAIETRSFRKEPYLTVTPRGAVELARLGLLDPVPEEMIDDKTKADPITKVIVCIQAGWFIVQCIARVAQHLPLSLLEIHTLAHVFIALLMYLFWYSKIYNALSPLIITKSEVVQTAALFSLPQQSLRTAHESIECLLSDELDLATINIANLGQPTDGQDHDTPSPSHRQADGVEKTSGSHNQGSRSLSLHNENNPDIISEASGTAGAVFQTPPNASITQRARQDGHAPKSEVGTVAPACEQTRAFHPEVDTHERSMVSHQSNSLNTTTPEDEPNGSLKPSVSTAMNPDRAETTLLLAQLAIKRLQSLRVHFIYFRSPENALRYRSTYLVPIIADFVQTPGCQLNDRRVRRPPSQRQYKSLYDFLPSKPWSHWVWILLIPYAAFHLSAWNTHFPTTIERWMWRGAGLSIIGLPIYLALGNLTMILPDRLWRVTQAYMFFAFAVVSASRIYFLVEALASLRESAPRIYETVEWTQFWPHE